jgi:uncharacterized Fe-S radical SAM superfamily protein PflX
MEMEMEVEMEMEMEMEQKTTGLDPTLPPSTPGVRHAMLCCRTGRVDRQRDSRGASRMLLHE